MVPTSEASFLRDVLKDDRAAVNEATCGDGTLVGVEDWGVGRPCGDAALGLRRCHRLGLLGQGDGGHCQTQPCLCEN